jgi:hypothetical protein
VGAGRARCRPGGAPPAGRRYGWPPRPTRANWRHGVRRRRPTAARGRRGRSRRVLAALAGLDGGQGAGGVGPVQLGKESDHGQQHGQHEQAEQDQRHAKPSNTRCDLEKRQGMRMTGTNEQPQQGRRAAPPCHPDMGSRTRRAGSRRCIGGASSGVADGRTFGARGRTGPAARLASRGWGESDGSATGVSSEPRRIRIDSADFPDTAPISLWGTKTPSRVLD